MADDCDSPKPFLSFSRRLLINDENELSSPLINRRAPLKRAYISAMSPSVLGLGNKKCRLAPVVVNGSSVAQQPNSQTKPEDVEQSPTKRKESEALIMKAVQLSDQDPDLIGDFSQPYALPVCSGKHSDLKTISPETLADLLRGKYSNTVGSHTIIDGRYPYEFEGGHIMGALNIYNKLALRREFLDNQQENIEQTTTDENKEGAKKSRHILIFHCEFSSERGPSLSRFLRNKDREINTTRYPQLYHPEIYILDGGYKAFFEKFKELCTPQSYLPMLSKDHKEQMKQFRVKSKSCNLETNKTTSQLRGQ